MSHLASKHRILIFALIAALASCSKAVKPSAEKASPKTFASPSEAGAALLAAAQSGDRPACSRSSARKGSNSCSLRSRTG